MFWSLSQSAKLIVKLTLQSLKKKNYQGMRFTAARVKSSFHFVVCIVQKNKRS